jgi:hypothetical protein
MNNRNELNSYIGRVQQRLRLGAWLQGAAVFTATALIVTVALVLVLNRLAFPELAVTGGRLVIFAALAAAALFSIALPLMHLTSARTVRRVEAANPELEQRLTTFHDRATKGEDPFLELLAAETLERTRSAEPASLVPDNRLFASAGGGLACLGVLVWIIAAGPGYLGYGASLLWTGPKKDAPPLYAISIAPGNVTVRRNSDQLITARITGMQPGKAKLFAHYQSASGWEPVEMQNLPNAGTGATYQFAFAGLPESVEYYVSAGPLVSPHFRVRVVDLPSVKDIHVTYHYPSWTGMKPVTEEHSGDLRAIEGTDSLIDLEMDRPLQNGQLAMDDGQVIHLARGAGNTYQGSISMQKDGAYHLATTDEGQPVRLSEDYFIATDKASPPEISIARPGGDYRASPIEEVTVGLKAADQFGLKDMHLHYSVNGGPDRDVSLLKVPGTKSAEGSHTLSLEEFKLTPGDLVSVYASAKDGHSEAHTEISFIQIDPFEREFSQSQQGGGGGTGSGSSNQIEISKREKELIAATWKQQNEKTATAKDAAAQGEFLSDAQQKLRDQVNALSVRMQSRDISEANKEFNDFDKDMQNASAAMAPAADRLKGLQWKDAIPLEQKALQALLRAEATFRQIQVAFGQAGGGSGGGNAGRDLASLFDLELDTAKNQYETAQTASPAEQHPKDVQDALEKLDALAKRQQELANQQKNSQQTFQERWEQEMLRREAEQLQRQMEQLAQNGQDSSGSSPGQSSNSKNASDQSGSQDQSGSPSTRHLSAGGSAGSARNNSTDKRIEQSLTRLQEATEAMRRSGMQGQNTGASREAADQLRQASNLLASKQQQLASDKMGSLAREADRLKQEEHIQAGKISKLAGQQDDTGTTDLSAMMAQRREQNQLAQERQQLSDSLSSLQKNMRDAAREMASNQPGAAQKLRDALTEMDDSDLDNRVQRTADWLRRGINPNANGTEGEIAQGLEKLSDQLDQAQKGMGEGSSGQRDTWLGNQTAVLDQVQRLREEIERMVKERGGEAQDARRAQNDQGGQQRLSEQGRLSRNGQQAGPGGRMADGQQRAFGPGQQGTNQQTQHGSYGLQFGIDPANQDPGTLSGDVRYGGGGSVDGSVWNNINTGNNRYGQARQQPAPTDDSGNPADTERTYRQGMQELNRLRQMVQGDPQTAKEVAELTGQMQRLDPRRFPGNPAMVEQMHREVLSSVERLELQLERNRALSEARTGKPDSVPAGYKDSVAEYYKRLSRNP